MYVEVVGAEKCAKKIEDVGKRLPKAVNRASWNFMQTLASRYRKWSSAGHKGSGYLSSTKGTFAKKIGEGEYAIFMPYYTRFLESGTSAHVIPQTWKTMLWAKKHGMTFKKMRHIIATRGTNPHPFTTRILMEEYNKLPSRLQKHISAAISR